MAPLLLANSTRDFSLRLDLSTRGKTHSFGRPSTIVIFFIPVPDSLTTATVDGNLNLAVILFEPSLLINPSPLPHRFLGTWCHLRPLILVGLDLTRIPDQISRHRRSIIIALSHGPLNLLLYLWPAPGTSLTALLASDCDCDLISLSFESPFHF